jgi:hypothetical protein
VQSLDTSAGAAVIEHPSTTYAPRFLIAAVALTGAGLLAAL